MTVFKRLIEKIVDRFLHTRRLMTRRVRQRLAQSNAIVSKLSSILFNSVLVNFRDRLLFRPYVENGDVRRLPIS